MHAEQASPFLRPTCLGTGKPLDAAMRAALSRVMERSGMFANMDGQLKRIIIDCFHVIEPVRGAICVYTNTYACMDCVGMCRNI